MSLSHTEVGDTTEYRFFLYCIENGIPISKPLTNNLPYDCIIDWQGKLLKIQIKTGYSSPSRNSFIFNCRSTSKNYSEVVMKTYENKIDGFITWYKEKPENFYYIPIEKANKSTMIIYYGENPTKQQNYHLNYLFNAALVQ